MAGKEKEKTRQDLGIKSIETSAGLNTVLKLQNADQRRPKKPK